MKQFFLPFWEVLETLAIALVSLFIIYTFMAQPFIVQGASMEPNFSDGDYILIDEITYRFREPQRGEVNMGTITFHNNPLPRYQASLEGCDQTMDSHRPLAAMAAPANPPMRA